jgi:hypothetical protein
MSCGKSTIETIKYSKDEFKNLESLEQVKQIKKSFIKCCKQMNNSNRDFIH